MEALLKSTGNGDGKLLYSLYYEQQQSEAPAGSNHRATDTLDLAFDDEILEDVKNDWKRIAGSEVDDAAFMRFEERAGMNEEDDDNDNNEY